MFGKKFNSYEQTINATKVYTNRKYLIDDLMILLQSVKCHLFVEEKDDSVFKCQKTLKVYTASEDFLLFPIHLYFDMWFAILPAVSHQSPTMNTFSNSIPLVHFAIHT